ncbi:hypothetical protein HPB51_023297 [Rhipicephalus microplus]|uniref:WWE domain-containing protein n=1 Tax=Rhipicephalus microplus TaxID=6941 RepID=A0A9J6ECV7_RHIMP|nr:hypothetical protein HPB51_023297 [Rhipicephalus microplus]
MLLPKRQWKWFDDRTGRWNAYTALNNKAIDDAYCAVEPSVHFTAGRRKYTVQFSTMVQINEETGNWRPVMLAWDGKPAATASATTGVSSATAVDAGAGTSASTAVHPTAPVGAAASVGASASVPTLSSASADVASTVPTTGADSGNASGSSTTPVTPTTVKGLSPHQCSTLISDGATDRVASDDDDGEANSGRLRIDAKVVTNAEAEENHAREKATLDRLSSAPATARKIDFFTASCSEATAQDSDHAAPYLLMHLDILNAIMGALCCKACHGPATIVRGDRDYGLAVKVLVQCERCGEIANEWTSPRANGTKTCNPFEVNLLASRAMVATGNGQTKMNDIFATMGISHRGMHHKTFQRHLKNTLAPAATRAAESAMSECAEKTCLLKSPLPRKISRRAVPGHLVWSKALRQENEHRATKPKHLLATNLVSQSFVTTHTISASCWCERNHVFMFSEKKKILALSWLGWALIEFLSQMFVCRACVGLLSIPVEPDTLHGVLRLSLRLTRCHEAAQAFAALGGPRLLLGLTQASAFSGFASLASLLVRHVVEEPPTLAHAMDKVARTMATAGGSPVSSKELHYVLRVLGPAACRDPKLFQEVATNVLRISLLPMSKRPEEEESRYTSSNAVQILKCVAAKGPTASAPVGDLVAQVMSDLLNVLPSPLPTPQPQEGLENFQKVLEL